MLKKKSFYIVTLILGIGLFALSFAFPGEEVKQICGLLIGGGAALFGMSIAQIYNISYEMEHPEVVKQNAIENRDERNQMIRDKAKAKAGSIIRWLIMIITYIMSIFRLPIWTILTAIGIFLLYDILTMIFINQYQKEL